MSKLNAAPFAVLALATAIGCNASIGDRWDSADDPGGVTGSGTGSGTGGLTGPGHGTTGVPSDCYPVPTRIWKLSDSQYQRAVTDLLPSVMVPAIQTPGRSRFAPADYADELPVSGSMAAVFRQTAKDVAGQAVTNINTVAACRAGEAPDACAGRFIDEFTPRAWRRPLTTEDRTALLSVYQAGSPDGFATGVRLVLEAILQSPSFLYRTELGAATAAGKVALTPYELASSLSFFLLDSIPDPTLWGHAVDGTIADEAVWKQETNRLLQLPRVQDNLVQVLVRWLGAEQVLAAEVQDPTAFPAFDSLRDDMLLETRQFLGGLLAGQGTIKDLLTSHTTQISSALAPVYGVTVSGTNVQTVMLPASQRSGILTQAGIIAGWAKPNRSVHRGLFVFREMLCGQVPSPPAGVNLTPPPGVKTERDFAAYRAANSCTACHSNFDPIGLSYENYDPYGRFITERDGAAVISSGTVTLDDQQRTYGSVVELGALLADSTQVKECVARKLSTYAFGERPSEANACIAENVQKAAAPTGPKLVDLFTGIMDIPAFRNRIAN
jgi:Protein of unknown function (DUF1592)/Protein of unknown function (DUF1595)/Protein of unknown function (DUF1588)/Protein of unknown function (DUF1585)